MLTRLQRWSARFPRRVVIAGVALGTAVGVGGIAVAQNGTSDAPEPPPSASTAIDKPLQFSASLQETGPGMSADQATAQVLKTLGDPSVTSAEVTTAPADSGESGNWLTVSISSDQPRAIEQQWLAELVQGAVDDLMRTNEAATKDVLSGGEVVDQDSSGQQVTTPLGHGGVVGGQVFGSPSDDALRQQVQAAADKYGLAVDSVRVLHPLESALAVTVTVPNGPIDGWDAPSLEHALEGAVKPNFQPNVEGLYLELQSPSGEVLLKSSYAFRVPMGSGWAADGQDERFGIDLG